jgi:hypothetical protein
MLTPFFVPAIILLQFMHRIFPWIFGQSLMLRMNLTLILAIGPEPSPRSSPHQPGYADKPVALQYGGSR